MNPWTLNHRITIQQRKTTEVPGSRPVTVWTDVRTVFAARSPWKGREFAIPTALVDELLVRYAIRYRPGITPDMRIVDGGRIYNIVAVLDDVNGDRRETNIVAKEVSDG